MLVLKMGWQQRKHPLPAHRLRRKKCYRAQIGAYSVKANTDTMLAKIKAAGFTDAFVKYSE